MSHKEAQNVYGRDTSGRRIRFLRGSLSQTDFAKKVGISRSAVANYETGRTVPSEAVLRSISEAFEISPEFLISGEAKDASELATALGVGPNHLDDLTADEWAIIRVLRLCTSDVASNVVRQILDALKQDDQAKRLADPLTIEGDVTRLIMILELDGQYHRGISRGNVDALIRELAKRLDAIDQGPQ